MATRFSSGGTSALTINVNLYRKLGYDTLSDFAPITNMTEVAMIFCVNRQWLRAMFAS